MAGTVKQIIISVTSLICGSVAVDYVKPVVANFLSPQSSPPSAPPPALEPPPARPQPMPRPTWSVPIAVLEPAAPVVPPSEPAVAPSEPTLKFVTPTPATQPKSSTPRATPRVVTPAPAPSERNGTEPHRDTAVDDKERWNGHWQDRGTSRDREPLRKRERGGTGRGDRRDSKWTPAPRRERPVRRSPYPPPVVQTDPSDGWPVNCGFERPCSQRRPRKPEWRLW